MLNKLLFFDRGKLQLSIVLFGTLLGLLLLLIPLQLFFDFKVLLTQKSDLLKPQYMVVNKEVRTLGSITGTTEGFSENELERLKNQPGVEEIAVFESNHFYASGVLKFGETAPQFQTDLFLEAIPDKFLDQLPSDWKWTEGKEIPIILPTDFINLYNFSFAATHDLPQVSKSIIKMAPFKIIVDSMGTRKELDAHIAGFSDRVNTILVPLVFLTYGNSHFVKNKTVTKPGRMIINSKDPTNGTLTQYLESHGYETNQELLRNSKLSNVLRVVALVMSFLGILIVILSATAFFQFAQLVVNRKEFEIRTLIQLGYFPKTIWIYYIKIFSIIIISITCISFIILTIFKPWFVHFAENFGFELPEGISLLTIGIGLVVVFVYLMVTLLQLRGRVWGFSTNARTD